MQRQRAVPRQAGVKTLGIRDSATEAATRKNKDLNSLCPFRKDLSKDKGLPWRQCPENPPNGLFPSQWT
jgi:hypothetical protein